MVLIALTTRLVKHSGHCPKFFIFSTKLPLTQLRGENAQVYYLPKIYQCAGLVRPPNAIKRTIPIAFLWLRNTTLRPCVGHLWDSEVYKVHWGELRGATSDHLLSALSIATPFNLHLQAIRIRGFIMPRPAT